GLDVGHKSTEIDLVTEADLASERLIVAAIRARFPDHSILSEEGLGDLETHAQEAASLWLVDPLDGTVNYAHGFPFWSVSLALAERGRVVLGVSYDPVGDEIFWAERGGGAWRQDAASLTKDAASLTKDAASLTKDAASLTKDEGERIRVSSAGRLRDALLATGFAYKRATLAENNLAEFDAIMPRVQGVRRAGTAVLDLAYVAAGRLDGYWEMHLNPWDWAAGWLLVEEAGGTVTDLEGNPWSLEKKALVASNGPLHDKLLSVLEGARQRRTGRSSPEGRQDDPT
ncbi:MAG: inositol monophosphatase family protein, partial [Anaerolineae bacterium]